LINADYKSPKKQRPRKKKHTKRDPKENFGELLQLDATPFDWFGIGKNYALHGAIDDNTGIVTALHMTENECLQGYTEITRDTLLNYGVPLSMYADKHTIFRSPKTSKNDEEGLDSNLTQYGKSLDELGVNIIFANSPQAKGKIERLWETLQSRLPVEFELQVIKTIEEANKYLKSTYLKMHNDKFAKPIKQSISVPWNTENNIDDILCVREERKLDNACTFSFKGKILRVIQKEDSYIPAKSKVTVLVNIRYGIRVQYEGLVYETVETTREKTSKTKNENTQQKTFIKPYLLHSTPEWKQIWHSQSYQDTLIFLHELFLEKAA